MLWYLKNRPICCGNTIHESVVLRIVENDEVKSYGNKIIGVGVLRLYENGVLSPQNIRQDKKALCNIFKYPFDNYF